MWDPGEFDTDFRDEDDFEADARQQVISLLVCLVVVLALVGLVVWVRS